MTLSRMTLSIMMLSVAKKPSMLSVVTLSAFRLNVFVVAPSNGAFCQKRYNLVSCVFLSSQKTIYKTSLESSWTIKGPVL